MNIFSHFGSLGRRFRKCFTLSEVLIVLAVLAVLIVLVIPVVTTRAQNRSLAVSFESEVKQMVNSLDGLPANEGKSSIEQTMMQVKGDQASFANSSGAYINKYMKVAKYCGDLPGECFASEYYQYKNNDRVTFDMAVIKGACALLKNGVSICLKPQVVKKNDSGHDEVDEITGWIDLTGPKGPNVYGRDLRTFFINLKNHAIIPIDTPDQVILAEGPKVCEPGSTDPNCINDPCAYDPNGHDCCTSPERSAKITEGEGNKNDPCCMWYSSSPETEQYKVCFPVSPPVCPEDDITLPCCIKRHMTVPISDQLDPCCATFKANNIGIEECSIEDGDSDYDCIVHPYSEPCCRKHPERIKLFNACCGYQSIYEDFKDICQSVCGQNRDSKQCCETKERRNEIGSHTPYPADDACCEFSGVNGVEDPVAAEGEYARLCCRLPQFGATTYYNCCPWKVQHNNFEFYSNVNAEGGTFDACCHDANFGIASTTVNANVKQEILSRCCVLGETLDDAQEDEACCDYLVGENGDDKLVYGQALRHCCKYASHKNKPQCCSHDTDGLIYEGPETSAQCCMPNSMYNTTPNPPSSRCCLTDVIGDNNGIWPEDRRNQCCEYNDIKSEKKWKQNCCYKGKDNYPNTKDYATYCCTTDRWNTDNNDECCQAQSDHANTAWINHCCNGGTTINYSEKDPNCCNTYNHWNLACCNLVDTDKDKRLNNCCSKPTMYASASEYRQHCCANDDRENHGNFDDTEANSVNSAVNATEAAKKYCCDPKSKDPSAACCQAFMDNNWYEFKFKELSSSASEDEMYGGSEDGTSAISLTYQALCCKNHGICSGCAARSMTNDDTKYNLPTCCFDATMMEAHKNSSDWQNACCSQDGASTKLGNSKFKSLCCSNSTGGVKGDGNVTNGLCCSSYSPDNNVCCPSQGKKYGNKDEKQCCSFADNADATTLCCDAANSLGWQGSASGSEFRQKCCAIGDKYCDCEQLYNKYLPLTEHSGELPNGRCCGTLEAAHKNERLWKVSCCKYHRGDSAYAELCPNIQPDGSEDSEDIIETSEDILEISPDVPVAETCATLADKGQVGDGCCSDVHVRSKLSSNTSLQNEWKTKCCENSQMIDYIATHSLARGTWKTYCCNATVQANKPDLYTQYCEEETQCVNGYDGMLTNGDKDLTKCCDVVNHAHYNCCVPQLLSDEEWISTKCCKDTDSPSHGRSYTNDPDSSRCCDLSGGGYATETCCQYAADKNLDFSKLYDSGSGVGCCTVDSYGSPRYLTESAWVAGCCDVNAVETAGAGNNTVACCKKLYNDNPESPNPEVFYPKSNCCMALNGKIDGQIIYECGDPCDPHQNSYFKTDKSYYPDNDDEAQIVKDCCAGGPYDPNHGFGDAQEWVDYCCGLKEARDKDAYQYATYTDEDDNTQAFCCEKRFTQAALDPTKVYYYVPSYATMACPAEGVAGKCSAYYDEGQRFYCEAPTRCELWLTTGNDNIYGDCNSDNNLLRFNCCERAYKAVGPDNPYYDMKKVQAMCCGDYQNKCQVSDGNQTFQQAHNTDGVCTCIGDECTEPKEDDLCDRYLRTGEANNEIIDAVSVSLCCDEKFNLYGGNIDTLLDNYPNFRDYCCIPGLDFYYDNYGDEAGICYTPSDLCERFFDDESGNVGLDTSGKYSCCNQKYYEYRFENNGLAELQKDYPFFKGHCCGLQSPPYSFYDNHKSLTAIIDSSGKKHMAEDICYVGSSGSGGAWSAGGGIDDYPYYHSSYSEDNIIADIISELLFPTMNDDDKLEGRKVKCDGGVFNCCTEKKCLEEHGGSRCWVPSGQPRPGCSSSCVYKYSVQCCEDQKATIKGFLDVDITMTCLSENNKAVLDALIQAAKKKFENEVASLASPLSGLNVDKTNWDDTDIIDPLGCRHKYCADTNDDTCCTKVTGRPDVHYYPVLTSYISKGSPDKSWCAYCMINNGFLTYFCDRTVNCGSMPSAANDCCEFRYGKGSAYTGGNINSNLNDDCNFDSGNGAFGANKYMCGE